MKCLATQVQTQTCPMSLWAFCLTLTLCQIWLHFSDKFFPSSGAKINRPVFPYAWDWIFLCACSKTSKFMSNWGGMWCSVLGRWNDTAVLDWAEDPVGHQHLWKQVKPQFTWLWALISATPSVVTTSNVPWESSHAKVQAGTCTPLRSQSLYFSVTESGLENLFPPLLIILPA